MPPWTISEFAAWLEDEFDRRVVLLPWARGAETSGPCSSVYVLRDRFIVYYDSRYSERHQRQQIFHEFAHILCGHNGEKWRPEMAARPLFDGIEPEMVERLLHRRAFDSEEERTAELLGTRLAVLSRRQDGDGRFDRIASAFFEPMRQ